MNAVEIRLNQSDLSSEMGAMRVWLDEQGYESSGFSCSDDSAALHIRVLFKAAYQAQEFAERFGGRAVGSEGPLERQALRARLVSGIAG
jgi:hypothetical protein